jgi:hypothetical protein
MIGIHIEYVDTIADLPELFCLKKEKKRNSVV